MSTRWRACRWSKKKNRIFYGGCYKNEETAAHASDTLARKLIANGEKGHKLNFPDDYIEVYPEEIERPNYMGVYFHEKQIRWSAKRWSKHEKKYVHNRTYTDEETAAHASDTLAKKLIANGEKGHKLNFPNEIEVDRGTTYQNKNRKRPNNAEKSQGQQILSDLNLV